MELQDQGQVTLHIGPSGASLRHKVTREVVALPATADPHGWFLAFDDEGFAFASHADIQGAVWASDLFRLRAARAEGGQLMVLDDSAAWSFQEHMSKFRRKHLLLKVGAKQLMLVCWIFTHIQFGGCRIWWGLTTLWHALEMSQVKAHEWLSNMWRWFAKKASKLQLHYPHMRQSVRGRAGPSTSGPGPHYDGRVLPEAAASTAALLMVVASSCRSSHSTRKLDEAAAWGALLDAVLSQCLPSQFSIQLVPGQHCPWDELPTGASVVTLECHDRVVILAGISSEWLGAWPSSLCAALQGSQRVPLKTFVLELEAAGLPHGWLYSQVLLQVAQAMEGQILQDQDDGSVQVQLSQAPAANPTQQKALGKLAKAMQEKLGQNTGLKLCKYFYAGRQVFSGKLQYLSLACDATRMGKKQTMVGCVALPNNLFMWAPPQDIGLRMGGGVDTTFWKNKGSHFQIWSLSFFRF
jgi:hypothetical protein